MSMIRGKVFADRELATGHLSIGEPVFVRKNSDWVSKDGEQKAEVRSLKEYLQQAQANGSAARRREPSESEE